MTAVHPVSVSCLMSTITSTLNYVQQHKLYLIDGILLVMAKVSYDSSTKCLDIEGNQGIGRQGIPAICIFGYKHQCLLHREGYLCEFSSA